MPGMCTWPCWPQESCTDPPGVPWGEGRKVKGAGGRLHSLLDPGLMCSLTANPTWQTLPSPGSGAAPHTCATGGAPLLPPQQWYAAPPCPYNPPKKQLHLEPVGRQNLPGFRWAGGLKKQSGLAVGPWSFAPTQFCLSPIPSPTVNFAPCLSFPMSWPCFQPGPWVRSASQLPLEPHEGRSYWVPLPVGPPRPALLARETEAAPKAGCSPPNPSELIKDSSPPRETESALPTASDPSPIHQDQSGSPIRPFSLPGKLRQPSQSIRTNWVLPSSPSASQGK